MADCFNQVKKYKLLFLTGVASPVFTGKKIRGEASAGSEPLDVILVDSQTNEIVDVATRVKIVLLPRGFDGVWTSLEFENNIITVWKNKKNILQGELSFNLEHGRGSVGNIWIKHDKNHLSKSWFRLGAMIDDSSFEIKEAVTDPFEAKDYRIELNSKNRPVTLSDKVSKLKNVAKKGSICKRLENENIIYVKDFLDRLYLNHVALQKIYGSNGKRWEVTVRHAKTAISDNKCNVSGSVGSNTREPDEVSLVDHNGCTKIEVESYQQSPSSNDMMWMAYDPFLLEVDMLNLESL